MNEWAYNEYGTISVDDIYKNAEIIRTTLVSKGWSINAIAALLANMEVESGVNPARWENDYVGNLDGGFGLVQWTPATKFFEWAGGQTYSGDKEIERILFEVDNNLQYAHVGGEFSEKSFADWTTSGKRPGYLAAEFMLSYERPLKQGWDAQIQRARLGEKWFEFFTGMKAAKWIPIGMIIVITKKKVNL